MESASNSLPERDDAEWVLHAQEPVIDIWGIKPFAGT